ncbi:MAG: hypothetical protein FJ220_02770 [Kiritimatiellaceae bacterium]|nr:hypothetical protein [Kiritimatiellaceae bacterium]
MRNASSILVRIVLLIPLAFSIQALAGPKQVLIFSGGWKGHFPQETAVWMQSALENAGFEVTRSDSLSCLDNVESLKMYDLIIPNWTAGEINTTQLKNLSDAVKSGAGLAGVHGGMGDAFRDTPEYEAMVGGQFLKHPYVGEYRVDRVVLNHPVMKDVPESFVYRSEHYFMRVSTNVTVLADSDYSSETPGLRMPVVWVKTWGKGRVFYSALGHNVEKEYATYPDAWTMFINGSLWAARVIEKRPENEF